MEGTEITVEVLKDEWYKERGGAGTKSGYLQTGHICNQTAKRFEYLKQYFKLLATNNLKLHKQIQVCLKVFVKALM